MSNDVKQNIEKLSIRENQVLSLLCKQHTAKEIAHILGMGVSTVDTYKARIRDKVGVYDFRELCSIICKDKES